MVVVEIVKIGGSEVNFPLLINIYINVSKTF